MHGTRLFQPIARIFSLLLVNGQARFNIAVKMLIFYNCALYMGKSVKSSKLQNVYYIPKGGAGSATAIRPSLQEKRKFSK